MRPETNLEALRRGDLAGAKELRLPPGLTEFPAEIFGLSETLEVLDISSGSLTALPDNMGRLTRLRALFCSHNRFERLPPCLGDCQSLSQLGFRDCGIVDVPAECLPPSLRWLTLTNNRIEHLPAALGNAPHLQKLLLSGNRVRNLPQTLEAAANLELVRIAANELEHLPEWLTRLPRLAWLSWAGNPCEERVSVAEPATIPWGDLELGALLGEGASGRVYNATWRRDAGKPEESVAVKLFKGTMTSDGLPEREMVACLAAGEHPNLTGGLGQVVGQPDGTAGLVIRLVPPSWKVLAAPPSLSSCTRDVYDPDLQLQPLTALRLAEGVGAAAAHLHDRGFLHGDLYAHNILRGIKDGEAVLSDFGAASILPQGPQAAALQKVEVRAWGLLLGELLSACASAPPAELQALTAACVQPELSARPTMAEVLEILHPQH